MFQQKSTYLWVWPYKHLVITKDSNNYH